MSATLIIVTAPRFGAELSTLHKLHFAFANTLHVGGILATATSYVLLVHSLSTRFTIISGLLKFEMIEYCVAFFLNVSYYIKVIFLLN